MSVIGDPEETWPSHEEAFVLANRRYQTDAEFHARVELAEQAARKRLEADGMTVTLSYRVAIRMGAVLGLYASEVGVGR